MRVVSFFLYRLLEVHRFGGIDLSDFELFLELGALEVGSRY